MTTLEKAPGCPVHHGQAFDPFIPDAYPWLKQAQEEAPVFYEPVTDMWWVTRYADVKAVLADPKTFSSENVVEVTQLDPSVMDSFPTGHPLNKDALVNLDPPQHTRVRKLAQKAFSPKVVNATEAEIRTICDRLIDTFVDDGRANIVTQFSSILPTTVILTMVGAPVDRVPDVIQWDSDIARMVKGAPPLDPQERLEMSRRAAEANVWLDAFVEERVEHPRDDLASLLLHTTDEDGESTLTRQEVVSLIETLIIAGATTTKNFLPLMLNALLSNPDQWDAVRQDRSLLKPAIEEGLRVNNSMHGVSRLVTADTEIGGVAIAAGEKVFAHSGIAQRDPRMFESPERFDVRRANVAKNIGLGYGIHTCLGAPLARLELRIALERFMDRLPGLRLVPGEDMGLIPNFFGRLYTALWVEWDV